jgi:glycosyltransferase involved in cell wall biosynthesis
MARYATATRRTKRDIRRIEKYADYVVSHPPMALLQSRPFVLGLHIGLPFSAPASATLMNDEARSAGVRVLHAPSLRAAKGTAQIRQAVAELQRQGLDLEFVEVSGKPHAVVMQEMARCDFVVDQLYSDTPLATFAAEAAFHGKPAVVGGYYADQLHHDYPESAIPPSLYCHPQRMKEGIRRLASDPAFRRELGRMAKEYVTANWAPAVVAAKYMRLIQDDVPKEWLYDPTRTEYFLGACISEDGVRATVGGLVKRYGPGVLQLNDKPDLLRKLCEFALAP